MGTMRDLKHQWLGYLDLQEVAQDLASVHKDYQTRSKRPSVHPQDNRENTGRGLHDPQRTPKETLTNPTRTRNNYVNMVTTSGKFDEYVCDSVTKRDEKNLSTPMRCR